MQYYQGRNLIVATKNLCNLVEIHFYEAKPNLVTWHKDCLKLADMVSYSTTKSTQIRRVQSHLSSLGVSHLELWSPAEMSQMWRGEDTDTGIRVMQMEGYFIVTEILENSPAFSQLQVGDEILRLGDQPMVFASDIEKFNGKVTFWRDGKETTIDVAPVKIYYPFQPHITTLENKKYKVSKTGVLRLKSFTPIYFDEEDWKTLIRNAEVYDRLILDLRGNSGGDFVVMQKILSSFLCEPTDIGYLIQPRKKQEATTTFSEDMDGEAQIEAIKATSIVELQTYAGYPCYLGEINVLIDSDTASTAEIFTEAIKLRKGTHVLGQTSSGAVLLAIWYPTFFGKQHSLSIPVALYKNWKDEIIEGEGVRPDRILNYEVSAWRNGIDNWLLAAAKD
jgi:carboxyl-terminal processing protease